MKILALDTTQEYCSVALATERGLVVCEALAPRSHTDVILSQIESVLLESELQLNQLDALAFGCGPGSFTGLRIAAGVVQGLALGVDLSVVPVSSLATMAQGQFRQDQSHTKICVTFDARIQEVYWGNYQLINGVMQSVTDDALSAPGDLYLPPDGGQWLGVGVGWSTYPEIQERLSDRLIGVIPDTAPLAQDMIPIAKWMIEHNQAVHIGQAVPVYLRHKVAQTIEERAQARMD